MTTQELPLNVEMANDALELLTCYQDGLEEVVAKIAERRAIDRIQKADSSHEASNVQITKDDVRFAGQAIYHFMKMMVERGEVPESAIRGLKDMNDCASQES